ncbi:MAG: hypothetical protein H0W72_01525 [Planctomycetes bacterium]|nr:hypothetical protein [Planctomycetota bacterium]
MTIRNHDQSFGYWLNEPAILDHQRIARAMADLGASGYGIVRVIVRQTSFPHRSREVIAAVASAVAAAHLHGMRLVLDCEPHVLVGREMGRAFPQAIGQRLFRAAGPVRAGAFRVDFQLPTMDGLIFDHIAAAAIDDGVLRAIPVPDHQLVWETTMAADGIADERQDYIAGRPFAMRRHVRISGDATSIADGTLILYACFREHALVDFAAPEARQWYRDLIDDYADIPLDGLCWDEPAIAGDWQSYRYGQAFARRFAELNGYRLQDRLHLLDAPGLSPATARVRLDYYRTLNETLAEAQADCIAAARACFGNHILLGNHHTWMGEGGINDYRAGAVDYFRLNDPMDAGYTDCCWWDPASVAYSYALGTSLGRLTPSGEAEVNTWHWKPTNRSTAWNARLMSLMRITWFNIWYGDDADTCRFPSHYTWPTAVACMRRHQGYQRFLGDARPVVEIAVLHDWAGVCATNLVHAANLHKAFCLNLALRAQNANLAFDFIDARLLGSGTIVDGALRTDLGTYRLLIIPGAAVIDRASWHRIQTFAAAGGHVVFSGPPPTLDADGGDLTGTFAALLGIAPIHADAYDAWFRMACPQLPTARPERFDLAFPMAVDPERILRSPEGDACGARSPGGQVIWFSGYEPSEAVLRHARRQIPASVRCHSATVLYREYRDQDRTLLMLIAKEDEELSGLVDAFGYRVSLDGGESACLVVPDVGDAYIHSADDAGRACVAALTAAQLA